MESSPNGCILKTTPTPKAQRILRKEWEDCKSHDQGTCCESESPSNILHTRHLTNITDKSELNKGATDGHARMRSARPRPYIQRTTDNWGKQGAGEGVFPREEHTKWLSSASQPWKHTHKHITWIEQVIFRGMSAHTVTISEKGAMIWRRVGRSIWEGLEGGRRWGRCYCITISKIKTNTHLDIFMSTMEQCLNTLSTMVPEQSAN